MQLTSKRIKRTTKSLSLDSDVVSVLEQEASSKGLSLNALVNIILKKHESIDRYLENEHIMIVTKEIIETLLSTTKEKRVFEIIERNYSSMIARRILGAGYPLTLSNWLEFGCKDLLLRINWIQKFSLYTDRDGHLTLVFLHDLGSSWSKILGEVVSIYMASIFDVNTTIYSSTNSILLRLTEKNIVDLPVQLKEGVME